MISYSVHDLSYIIRTHSNITIKCTNIIIITKLLLSREEIKLSFFLLASLIPIIDIFILFIIQSDFYHTCYHPSKIPSFQRKDKAALFPRHHFKSSPTSLLLKCKYIFLSNYFYHWSSYCQNMMMITICPISPSEDKAVLFP